MKECFCFLFGLIVGIGSMIALKRWIMGVPEGRRSYFRSLHDNFPTDYHDCCPDMAIVDMLKTPEIFRTGLPIEETTDNDASR